MAAKPMPKREALTKACLCIDIVKELNRPGPDTRAWIEELLNQTEPAAAEYLIELDQARQTITKEIDRPPAGEFLIYTGKQPKKRTINQEENSMSHLILPSEKKNKAVPGDVSRAEFQAGFNEILNQLKLLAGQPGKPADVGSPGFKKAFDEVMGELNSLITRHEASIGKQATVSADDPPWLKEMAAKLGHKTKDTPTPAAPPLADGRNGFGEALHKESAPDSLDWSMLNQRTANKQKWGLR